MRMLDDAGLTCRSLLLGLRVYIWKDLGGPGELGFF